jgi:hypothetical protein
MRRAAVVVGLVVAAAVGVAHVAAPASRAAAPLTSAGVAGCGVARWPVKTLADRTARAVALARPVTVTVAALAALPVRAGTQTTRARGVERTVYRVRAVLVAAVVEADDDLHLELRDPRRPAATMIGEIPDMHCTVGARPALRLRMQRARTAFLAACGDPGATFAVYRPGATVTLTGVGFFDRAHGQRGVAPNAIELHPVLSAAVRSCR